MSGQGIIALSYVGLIACIVLFLYRIVEAVNNKLRFGTYVNYQNSNFFAPDGAFKLKNLIPLAGNGITNMLNLIAMTYAYKYAALAGINQGVLLTLNSLSAVYNIPIFYFAFGEKTTVA